MNDLRLEDSYNDLVELIYRIPINDDGWGAFCEKLTQVMDCSTVHILAFDVEYQAYSFSRAVNKFATVSDAAHAEVAYLHYPMEADPRWEGVFNPERKGWYQCHYSISDEFVNNSDLYQDLLLPFNMRYTAVHELILDEKLCLLIAVQTSQVRQPLNKDELRFLDKLLVHLKRVAAIQRHIYEFSSKAIMGYALVDKLTQPIILLDLKGQICHYNIATKQLSERSKLINIDTNKLILPIPYQKLLIEKIKESESLFKYEKIKFKEKHEDECIKVLDENGEMLYIFISLLVSEQEMKAFGTRPLVMLTIYHPDYTANLDAHLLYTAFGLSPAESKVALALLEGFLPKEIASNHRVNTDTVRKQLQSIYSKTSTKRQADLIKLLLNMPRQILNT